MTRRDRPPRPAYTDRADDDLDTSLCMAIEAARRADRPVRAALLESELRALREAARADRPEVWP